MNASSSLTSNETKNHEHCNASVTTTTSSNNVTTTSAANPNITSTASIRNSTISRKHLTPPTTNETSRRIIRKITPIDPKKLQQSGLDRKIAEAISKHKSQLGLNKVANRVSTTSPLQSPSSPNAAASIEKDIRSTVKTPSPLKKIIPPKITITAPEAPSDEAIKTLASLDSQQRLVHVKNLLNKKLLLKKEKKIESNSKLYEHLKPPECESSQCEDQSNLKVNQKQLLTVIDKPLLPSRTVGFSKLKTAEITTQHRGIKITKLTVQKSPQDIARKLDFQIEIERSSPEQKRGRIKSVNDNVNDIPKAAIKFCSKQQLQQQQSESAYNSIKHGRQKINFPEISPLKVHFSTSNIPQENPLPTIDSFKKTYNVSNAAYYNNQTDIKACSQTDFISTNYEVSSHSEPSIAVVNDSIKFTSASSIAPATISPPPATNSLIVLENKVLSQDEMIDLTELRLSTSKVDKPRFAIPHKPIPEVVIKQEKSDEYPLSYSTLPLVMKEAHEENLHKDIKSNKETSAEMVVISNKQNKKIIINAQKLKLPPDQLADLAKKIALRTGVSPSIPKSTSTATARGRDIGITKSITIDKSNVPTQNQQDVGNIKSMEINNTKFIPPNTGITKNEVVMQHSSVVTSDHLNSSSKCFVNKVTHTHAALKSSKTSDQELQNSGTVKILPQRSVEKNIKEVSKNSSQFLTVKEEPKTQKRLVPNPAVKSLPLDSESTKTFNTSFSNFRKPAVEIVDEPLETEDGFSAVDFIATLITTNPITQESSLELSPEEVNLNASCSMKLSPLCVDSYTPQNSIDDSELYISNQYSQSKSLHRIGNIITVPDNSLNMQNNQQMSTIVIESSSGQETILTKDSPSKFDSKSLNVLGKVKLDVKCSTDLAGSHNASNNSKPQTVVELNITDTNDPKNICLISSNEISIKDIDSKNSFKSEKFTSEISNENAMKNRNLNSMKYTENNLISSIELSSTIDNDGLKATTVKAADNVAIHPDSDRKTISTEVEKIVLQNLSTLTSLEVGSAKQSGTLIVSTDYNKEQMPGVVNQSLTESMTDSQRLDIIVGSTPAEQAINLKSILKSSVLSNKPESADVQCSDYSKVVIKETSEKINLQKPGLSEVSEIKSATTMPLKRISRFKKGKINLVKRNKTSGSVLNTSLNTTEFSNETYHKSNNKNKTNDEITKESIKQTIETTGELHKADTEDIEVHDDSKTLSVELFNEENKTNIEIDDKINNQSIGSAERDVAESIQITSVSVSIPQNAEKKTSLQSLTFDRWKDGGEMKISTPRKDEKGSNGNGEFSKETVANVYTEKALSDLGNESENIEETEGSKIKYLSEGLSDCLTENKKQDEKSLESNSNVESIYCKNIIQLLEPDKISTSQLEISKTVDLEQMSKKTLENMKQANVSIIDVVKHSQLKMSENYLVNSFECKHTETCHNSLESKNNKNLLEPVRTADKDSNEVQEDLKISIKNVYTKESISIASKNENYKDKIESNFSYKDPCTGVKDREGVKLLEAKAINMDSETIVPRRSLRSRISTIETEIVNTKNKQSANHVINDDDLEFLPVNAEIREFNTSKSTKSNDTQWKEVKNEKGYLRERLEIKSRTDISVVKSLDVSGSKETTPRTHDTSTRRTGLMNWELTSHSPSASKKTRYHSTIAGTNFGNCLDSLRPQNGNPLDAEDSCQDSSHDFKLLSPLKQRKRLKKTLEDLKKYKTPHSETDSEYDIRDYDCMSVCEESNENDFLGFEENTDCPFKNTQKLTKRNDENDIEIKTKGGTLKNWLTTGKAISPTYNKESNTKRLRNDESSVMRGGVPLKKRWDLSANLQEEIDITDDTSPVDDEEESVNIPINKKAKHGALNKVHSNKYVKLGESKHINIDHGFVQPRHLRKKSKHCGTDKNCCERKLSKRLHSKLSTENLKSVDGDEKELLESTKSINSSSNSDCYKGKVSTYAKKGNKLDEDAEKNFGNSEIDFKWHEGRQLKSKHKTDDTDNTKESDKEIMKNVDLDTTSTISAESLNFKRTMDNNTKINDNGKILDISIKSNTLHNISDCHKGKRSQHLKYKHMLDNTNIENDKDVDVETSLNISPKQENNKDKISIQSVFSTDDDQEFGKTKITKKESHNIKFRKITRNYKKIQLENIDNTSAAHTQRTICSVLDENSNNTEMPSLFTSLNKQSESNLKRALGTNTSAYGELLPTPAKRKAKCQLAKKIKIENADSENVSTLVTPATPAKGTTTSETFTKLKPITTPKLSLMKSETLTPINSGRKRKSCNTDTVSNFNPRLLLITKREQLETDEVLTETESGSGPIQCGLCLAHTFPSKWMSHLEEHYGVGWKVGEEKLNIKSRSAVLNSIACYIKDTATKGLSCRMCKKVYRSGLGLLMHIEGCGAQVERVACEFCKRDYAKSSFPIHLRSCHARIASENSVKQSNAEKSEHIQEIFGNTGRLKRHSTIKAENKLKVLGEELDKVMDNREKLEFDPKERVKYIPPLEGNFSTKWSEDIVRTGKASCPKKACKFISSDLKELSRHMTQCKYIKWGYFCNFCRRRVFKTEQEAIDHVINYHQNGKGKNDDSDCNLKTDDEQSSDDENDLSEYVSEKEVDDDVGNEVNDSHLIKTSKRRKLNKVTYSRNQSSTTTLRKKVFDARYNDLNAEVFKKWKNFLRQNYSTGVLFSEFITKYSELNYQEYAKYLPKEMVSMKFNFKAEVTLNNTIGEPETNIEWLELKRFESIHDKMGTFFYLGAPVKLCSWIPLPAHVNEQYLLVVYRRDMFTFTKFANPKQHHTIILILKVTQHKQVPKIDIHYGFIVKDGPVHDVSCLPSGGYDEAINRLGLVALATVSSSTKVYALPINFQATTVENKFGNTSLIEIKPSFILNLDVLDQQQSEHVLLNPQCLQICWSEYSGHQHIFASFSNGFIGIWDINNNSEANLNRFEVENIVNYAPLNYFYLGEKGIKSLALHYDTNGPRWLAASSACRKFVVYDIKSFMHPIVMREDSNKNILLCMDWCPLWETLLYSYCDSMPNNGRCVMAVNPANVMFLQNKLDFMTGGVTQVHYSPVTNMCVSAVDNGDLLFLNTKELHYDCTLGKRFGDRRLLCTMDVKQLDGKLLVKLPKGNTKVINKMPCNWSMLNENYKDKYGLIFKPPIKINENQKNTYLNVNRSVPLNVIPLVRVNALRCNLNLNAKHLMALGYENGFIRIIYFNKEIQFPN